MRLRMFLCCAAAVGCSPQGHQGNEGNNSTPTPANVARASNSASGSEVASNAASPDSDTERYFPLSRYQSFPRQVRSLLQRADIENDHCRGNSGDDPETLRACNRRWVVMVRLEHLGWCWGSERGNASSADDHWLRCSDEHGYEPGQLGRQPPYSEADIRELANEAGH